MLNEFIPLTSKELGIVKLIEFPSPNADKTGVTG